MNLISCLFPFLHSLSIYAIGVALPGMSNLAIANFAMKYGRLYGLTFASGVIIGSIVWGLLTLLVFPFLYGQFLGP